MLSVSKSGTDICLSQTPTQLNVRYCSYNSFFRWIWITGDANDWISRTFTLYKQSKELRKQLKVLEQESDASHTV